MSCYGFAFVGCTTGEGLVVDGLTLAFWLAPLGFPLVFDPGRFKFALLFAFELPFLFDLFELALRLSFAFSFLFAGLLRGLFSFVVVDSFEFSFAAFASGVFSTTASDDSPSLAVRLISIATV